jgi:TonB family protein
MTNARLCRVQSLALVNTIALLLSGGFLLAQDHLEKTSDVVYDRLGKDITPPKATYQPEPEYANKARKKKIQGTVMVSIVITPEGTVRDAKVMTSLDKDLDQKALEAVSKWKFQPATKDGKPVALRTVVELNFHLY